MLLIVGLVSVIVRPAGATTYQAGMRFVLGIEPEPNTGDYYTYDKYYTWLTAEYLIDDTAALVQSSAFAEAVSAFLASEGITAPAGAIVGSTQTGQLHRILTVGITWGDAQQLAHIANAVATVLPQQIARHFAQVGTSGVRASLIDPPVVGAVGASLREKLDLPMRLLLALVAGVGLAFLQEYLDTSVRSRQELEQAGIEVVAVIPSAQG
jgi:capsular polysaccharide biosynthesis protein